MQSLIINAREFPEHAAGRRTDLSRLALGRRPEALLHAWFSAIDTGLVSAYRPTRDAFLPL